MELEKNINIWEEVCWWLSMKFAVKIQFDILTALQVVQ